LKTALKLLPILRTNRPEVTKRKTGIILLQMNFDNTPEVGIIISVDAS
jgi:hypothetical protein